jgi:hypothetical protein
LVGVKFVAGYVAVLTTLWLVLVVLSNTSDADDAARCAARPDGQPVRALRYQVPFGPNITRLGIRAERAVIHSIGLDPAPPWDGRQVVYLGSSEAVVFAYDPREERTLRISEGSVFVSINAAAERYRSDRGCEPIGSQANDARGSQKAGRAQHLEPVARVTGSPVGLAAAQGGSG